MNRQEILNVWNGLSEIGKKSFEGTKYNYIMLKNKKKLVPIIRDIQTKRQFPNSKEVAEFEKERHELCIFYAVKDENGKPKTANNQYIVEDKEKFDIEYKTLEEKHKDAIKQIQDHDIEFGKYLLEEVPDFKIHTLSIEDLPSNMNEQEVNFMMQYFIEEELELQKEGNILQLTDIKKEQLEDENKE